MSKDSAIESVQFCQGGSTVKLRVSPLLIATAAVLLCQTAAMSQEGDASLLGFEPSPSHAVLNVSESAVFQSDVTRSNEELEQRIQQLEAQMNSMQSRPYLTIDQALAAEQVGTGGLFGSIEVTFLKPALSSALSVALGHGGNVFNPEYHADTRYVLGYRTDSGVGIRGRYWSFGEHLPFSPTFAVGAFSIDAQTADLEATVDLMFRQLDLGLSAGVRYATLEYGTIGLTPLFSPGTLRYEGLGPTFSLDGTRSIGTTGLSLFGNGRTSVLLGSVNQGLVIPVGTATELNDEVMMILESQLGVSWSRPVKGAVLDVRAAWETQYWASNTLSDDFLGIGSNLLMMGPTIGVELRY